jgi:hypothetical protein
MNRAPHFAPGGPILTRVGPPLDGRWGGHLGPSCSLVDRSPLGVGVARFIGRRMFRAAGSSDNADPSRLDEPRAAFCSRRPDFDPSWPPSRGSVGGVI